MVGCRFPLWDVRFVVECLIDVAGPGELVAHEPASVAGIAGSLAAMEAP